MQKSLHFHFTGVKKLKKKGISYYHLTDMHICVSVCSSFAHRHKQLLCTWPRPWAKDGSSTCPHGVFSSAIAQHNLSSMQPMLTQDPQSYLCLPGHIFRVWHLTHVSTLFARRHFFPGCCLIIVLITSQGESEIL